MTTEHIEHEVANLASRYEGDMADVRRALSTLRETIETGAKHRVVPFPSQSREVVVLQRQVSELQTVVGRLLELVGQLADDVIEMRP